jgi:hypothetical protein
LMAPRKIGLKWAVFCLQNANVSQGNADHRAGAGRTRTGAQPPPSRKPAPLGEA